MPLVAVGFPTRNEAETIGRAVAAVEDGLASIGLSRRAVLINADNGSRDGTPDVFAETPGRVRRLVVATGETGTGKGTNVLAILRAARDEGAQRVAVLDADVRSMEPVWIARMLAAVDYGPAAVAVPIYRRNRFEGNTTNHIVSPLFAAVLGVHVQQPIAGDFAFNRAFVERAVAWRLPESAQLYGIDAHLIGNAAVEGCRITQVPLGRKIHNPGFPKILFMSQQVIDAVFHVMAGIGRPRAVLPGQVFPRSTVDAVAAPPDPALVKQTAAKVRGYLDAHNDQIAAVFPGLASASRGRDGLIAVDAATWAELLADAIAAVASGDAAQARDHLVALYLCRVITYWQEIDRMAIPAVIDAALDAQTAAVVKTVAQRNLFLSVRPPTAFRPGYWAEGRQ
jgi:hypothetical protein